MDFIKSIFCRKVKTEQSTADIFLDTEEPENNPIKNQLGVTQITQEFQNADSNNLQYKRIALHALKKKKRYEKQLRDIDDTLSTLTMQRDALQTDEAETTVMSALNASLGTLEEILKNINLEMAEDSVLEIELEQLEDKELDKFSNVSLLDNLNTDTRINSELDKMKINS